VAYIANILTEEHFNDKCFYNVVNIKEDLIPNIPTLVIGWDKAKECYPTARVLDWKIDSKTYWTYGKRVKRDRFESDVTKFKAIALNNIANSITYSFFNVLTTNKKHKLLFFQSLKDNSEKVCTISNNMLYIYYPEKNKTIGLSLNDVEYEGGNPNKLLAILHNTPTIKFVNESDYMNFETRPIIKNKRFIIPYLSYLQC